MEISFINNFVSTRGGFKHETLMSIDSTIVRKSVCHYINRTWESYAYQSVMKKACHEEIEYEVKRLRDEHKERTGKKRLPKDMVFESELLTALKLKLQEL